MSEIESERSLVKGLLAGLVAGLAAAAAQSVARALDPPRMAQDPESDHLTADKPTEPGLEPTQPTRASRTIPWGVGALVGAAYGALAEFYPAATQSQGAIFGLVLMILTEETAAPKIELPPEPAGSESSIHLVSGVVAEQVRGVLRGML